MTSVLPVHDWDQTVTRLSAERFGDYSRALGLQTPPAVLRFPRHHMASGPVDPSEIEPTLAAALTTLHRSSSTLQLRTISTRESTITLRLCVAAAASADRHPLSRGLQPTGHGVLAVQQGEPGSAPDVAIRSDQSLRPSDLAAEISRQFGMPLTAPEFFTSSDGVRGPIPRVQQALDSTGTNRVAGQVGTAGRHEEFVDALTTACPTADRPAVAGLARALSTIRQLSEITLVHPDRHVGRVVVIYHCERGDIIATAVDGWVTFAGGSAYRLGQALSLLCEDLPEWQE